MSAAAVVGLIAFALWIVAGGLTLRHLDEVDGTWTLTAFVIGVGPLGILALAGSLMWPGITFLAGAIVAIAAAALILSDLITGLVFEAPGIGARPPTLSRGVQNDDRARTPTLAEAAERTERAQRRLSGAE